eukprot:TRINITY_DN77991_c0_g1_i1.p1 TRINITY_DN77991_c0_g1~~TRINITY_DN77991_c0_g1_i1.p1  ORF type:complete len:370 (+),score=30.03 TRINITY_DN77991_c0_g1_i1:147-1112(+)
MWKHLLHKTAKQNKQNYHDPTIDPKQKEQNKKIAVVSVHETPQIWPHKDDLRILSFANETRVHYCNLHGYTYVFNQQNISSTTNRHPSWNRVVVLQELLPRFEWVLYWDSDVAVTDHTVKLEQMINKLPSTAQVVFTDAPQGFNTGGILLRNSTWTMSFLRSWWDAGIIVNGTLRHESWLSWLFAQKDVQFEQGKRRRKTKQWGLGGTDQAALWDLVLNEFTHNSTSCSAQQLLISQDGDWDAARECFRTEAKKFGFTYTKRTTGSLYFWAPDGSKQPRGLTFFFPDSAAVAVFHPHELWKPGDFVIHTHNLPSLQLSLGK